MSWMVGSSISEQRQGREGSNFRRFLLLLIEHSSHPGSAVRCNPCRKDMWAGPEPDGFEGSFFLICLLFLSGLAYAFGLVESLTHSPHCGCWCQTSGSGGWG